MNNEKNRTVCITGASRGLGYALVEKFLENTGCEVLAVTRGSADLDKLEIQWPGRLRIVNVQITSEDGLETVFNELRDMPPLGYLIHNAGGLVYKPFAEITPAELRSVYEINVFAPFLLTQKLLPVMEAAHVINVSSVGGVQGSMKFPGLSAYSSSKAALNCLTEMWSEEFKDTDHVFNCLALGSVETEMFKTAFPGVPASSSPSDMAAYIVNFAQEAPGVMRGKIISLSRSNP